MKPWQIWIISPLTLIIIMQFWLLSNNPDYITELHAITRIVIAQFVINAIVLLPKLTSKSV